MKEIDRLELEEIREQAEELGLSLQEYILFRILQELEQLPYKGDSERGLSP